MKWTTTGAHRVRCSILLWCVLLAPLPVLAQRPPQEPGPFKPSELVELLKLDPTIKLDIRYATKNNFLGRAVYKEACAFLQRPAAEAVVRANKRLRAKGYGMLIYDAYRPWHVTELLWNNTPNEKKMFVADPDIGSRHNRGCAVDLTLYDLKTGKEVSMPSGYDEMTERSSPNYTGATPESSRLRDLLIATMRAEGFTVFATEWWHFDHQDWKDYPILDVEFRKIPDM
jgi:zinc D-Ala-D-Ala dipeptidase